LSKLADHLVRMPGTGGIRQLRNPDEPDRQEDILWTGSAWCLEER
jgi:hypothetical protein